MFSYQTLDGIIRAACEGQVVRRRRKAAVA
jgi:hypothetical protein